MTRTHLRLSAALAAGLILAACGSSSASSPGTTTSPSTTAGAAAPSVAGIAPIPASDRSPAGSAGVAPTAVVPSGPPPSQLESADLIPGTGPAAQLGESLTVQYVLATYSTGKVIQTSWGSGAFSFTLAPRQVIDGWVEGVVGMKAGGRRELIIPPSLGYGATSPGAGISANDTLVFVIDLIKIG